MYNVEYLNYDGNDLVEIAKVINTETGKDEIFVDYEKNLYDKLGYHFCFEVYDNEEGSYPVAKVDDMHRSILVEHADIFLAMVLHELGHFKNGDLDKWADENANKKSIADERMKCILENRVMEEERLADAFAVECVGKNAYMRCLDF